LKPLLTILTLLTLAQAQIPDEYWQWVNHENATYSNRGRDLCIDLQGNVIVVGGGGTWNNYSGRIYKYDSNGTLLWYKGFGGEGFDYGISITVDNVGNIYLTGLFESTANFGSFSLNSNGGRDIFIAKIDPDGNWLWVKHAGGANDDSGYSIVADDNGNVYITGSYHGVANFGPLDITSAGNTDIFVAKIDSSGNWIWVQSAGGSIVDRSNSISKESGGSLFITGTFQGESNFGEITLLTDGSHDIFVAKIDSVGNWLWAVSAGGTSTDEGHDIDISNQNEIYLTGSFQSSSAHFGEITLSTVGAHDIFVAKIDNYGNWVWAKSAGGQTNDYGWGISVSVNGIYITGSFKIISNFGSISLSSNHIGENWDDIFVSKIDYDGNWIWAERAGGSYDDNGYSIVADDNDNIFVTGNFKGAADFGPFNYTTGTYQEDYNTYFENEMFIGKLLDYGEINECMFYPNIEGTEYLELGRALNYDIVVDDTPVYTLSDTVGFPVIIIDSTKFNDTFGLLADSLDIEGKLFGPLLFELPDDSATIKIVWNDVVLYSFTYRANEYPESSGLGPSLEKTNDGWGPSFGNGTPGRENGQGRISLPQDADPFYLNLNPHFENPVSGGEISFSVSSDLETIVYPSISDDTLLVVTPLWHGNDHLTITAYYENGTQQERRMLVSLNNVFLDVPNQTTAFATIDTLNLNTWYSRTPQDGVFTFTVSSSNPTIVEPFIVQDTLLVLQNHWFGQVDLTLTISSNNDGTYTQTFPVNVPNPFNSVIPNQIIVNDTTQIHNLIQWFPHPVIEDVSFSISSSNTNIVQATLMQDTLIQCDVLIDELSLYGFTNIIVNGNYPFNHSVSDTFTLTNSPGNKLVMNEIHYNPAGSQGSDAEYEFIELANSSDHTIRLEKTVLSNEINFEFPSSAVVLPDSFVVVARDKDVLLSWYPNLNSDIVFEGFSEFLSNNTGTLQLSLNNYTIDSLSYSDSSPWPENADGIGPSLELVNQTLNNEFGENWKISNETGGTPGLENSVFDLHVPTWLASPANLVFNEDVDTTLSFSIWYDIVEDNTADSLLEFSFFNTDVIQPAVNGDSVNFTIEANWNGETNMGIRVSDGTLFSEETLHIIVNAVNDAPIITIHPDTSFNEDGNISLVLYSADIEDDEVSYSAFTDTNAVHGSIEDSLLTIAANDNWNGSSVITAIVSDGEYSDSTNFTLTVNPINDAPTITVISDTSFNEDDTLSFVLVSTDIDGDDVIYSAITDTNAVQVSIADSTLAITSDDNWNGTSVITAIVSDGEYSDSTNFTLTVNPVNDAPIISTVFDTTYIEDDSLSFVLSSMDIDSDSLTYSAFSDTTAITIIVSDSLIFFTSSLNWNGSSIITAIVSDGEYSDSTDFTLTVNPVNDAPSITAIPDTSYYEEDSLSFVLSSIDIDSDDLTYSAFSDTTALTVTVSDSLISFTSSLNWNGSSIITAIVSDGEYSDSTDFTLTVSPVNDSPIISVITDTTFNEDDSLSFVLASTDIDGDGVNYSALTDTNAVQVSITDSLLTITANDNWNGVSVITAIVSDGEYSDSTDFTLTVNPVNDAPVITAITDKTYSEDDSLSFVLLSTDIDSDELVYSAFSDTTAITVTVPDSLISFTSSLNWNGSGTITAIVTDGEYSDSTDFTLTVNPINDAPSITALTDTSFNEDGSTEVLLGSFDIDGDDVSYSAITDTNAVQVSITDSLLTITANDNWNGTSVITAIVSDGEYSDSTDFTLTINPVNDAPVLTQQFPDVIISEDDFGAIIIPRLEDYYMEVDSNDVMQFSSNALNGGLDSIVFISESEGLLARGFSMGDRETKEVKIKRLKRNSDFLSNQRNNNISVIPIGVSKGKEYAPLTHFMSTSTQITRSSSRTNHDTTSCIVYPTLNFTGEINIELIATDLAELMSQDTLILTIEAVNDPPVISSQNDIFIFEDDSIVFSIIAQDVDSENLIYEVYSSSSEITISLNNENCTLTPNENWYGESQIFLIVSDEEYSDTTEFHFSVLSVNDSPVLETPLPNFSLDEDNGAIIIIDRLEDYFTDVDGETGDSLRFTISTNSDGLDSLNLNLEPNSTGIYLRPKDNYFGEITISVIATDDSLATVSDSFLVEIINVNDPPVITIQQTASTIEETEISIPFSVYDEEGADLIMSGMADTTAIEVVTNDTNLFITPELNWFGETNVFLSADDGDTTVTDTIMLTVENVNDAPVLSSDFSIKILSRTVSIPVFVNEVDGDAIQVNGVFRLNPSASWLPMNVNRDTSYAGNTDFLIEWETRDQIENQINWAYSETVKCSLWVNDGLENSNALGFDSLTIVNIAGDYNLDVAINAGDIGILESVFYNEGVDILASDIGPSTGTAPFVTTVQDSVIDFEDLATFTQSWYWSVENLPNTNRMLMAKAVVKDGNEIFTLQAKSDGIFTLGITELITSGFDLFIQYDTTKIQFETIQSQINESAISLTYHHIENGYFSLSTYSKNGVMDFSGDLLELTVSSNLLDDSEMKIGLKRYENPNDNSPFEYYRKTIESFDLLPKEFALHQNYPNPFNPTTTLRYDLPEDAKVSLVIYDIMGREVITLVNQIQKAGFKSVIWNGTNGLNQQISAGMYFYRISAGDFTSVKKMVLLK